MSDTPIWKLSAGEIARLVSARDVSAIEVLDAFLERIDAHNEALNAVVHLDPDAARRQARDVDARVAGGEQLPLAGVPVGVKDLEHVAGMPTTFGSLLHEGEIAARDDVHVARLRAAGAVIAGKTATPEFGAATWTDTKIFGTTRNPWNLERTPGGSSGGSAAAVAAALLPLCSGSDGGGSIRIPSSYCGLPGLKPTYGRIPMGAAPDSGQRSVLGGLARTPSDLALYLDATAGPHERDQFSLPAPSQPYASRLDAVPDGLRAVWSDDLGFGTCASGVAQIARRAADDLATAAGITWSSGTVTLQDPWAAWSGLGLASGRLNRDRYLQRVQDLTPVVAILTQMGDAPDAIDRAADAVRVRWENNHALAALFDDADLILTPTTPTTAFVAEGPLPMQIDGRQIPPQHSLTFTYPFNVSGHPAVSLPCGTDAGGLPVGLQVVARRHEEHTLLALACAWERARPWQAIAPRFA